MVRRSKPGNKDKLVKPQLKVKTDIPKIDSPFPTIDDAFPLAKDEVYQNLSSPKKLFVYYQYLKPISGWTNPRIYKEVRPGVTDLTATANSYKWLSDPEIKHCMNKLKQAYDERLGYTSDRIMSELGALAFSDIANYFDENGLLRTNPIDLPPSARAAIASFELRYDQQGEQYWKITQWNKNDAIKTLVKIQGLEAPARHEVSGPGGGPIQMETRSRVDLSFLSDKELELLCKIVKGNSSKGEEED